VPHLHRDDQTHDDGRFTISRLPAGVVELVVQRIGYRPASLTVELGTGDTSDVTVRMTAAALELAPTVVTGTLSERAREDALSPTAVVSGARLDEKLTETIAGTLQDQPGVALTSLGPATGRPVLRGLGGDRIVMLEDGVRPGDMSSTSSDHAVAIEPLTAGRLEVVRGPMSLLYGSSALGGVVNVIRDEIPTSRPDHWHGEVSAQGVTVNSGGGIGGFMMAPAGTAAVRAEASARGAGDLRTPEGVLSNTDLRTYTAGIGAGLIGATGHAGASYRYYTSHYGIPGGFVGGHPEGVDIDMRRHSGRLEGETHREGHAWHVMRAAASFTDYWHTEVEASGSVGTVFEQKVGTLELSARHEELGPFGEGAVGVRAQYRDIQTGGSLKTPSTYDWNAGAYVVEGWRRGPWEVQGGIRFDWSHYVPRDTTATITVGGEQVPVRPRTFGAASASLGGLVKVAEGVRAGVSLARAFRTPDFNELYSDGPHLAANSYDVGDPSLDPEYGLGFDAFVRISRATFDAELAGFWNTLDGYIFPSSRGRAESGPQGGRPRFQYTNEDARFVGFETDVAWRPLSWLTLAGDVSLVNALFTAPRDSIPIITPAETTFVAASVYPPLIPPVHGRFEVRAERGAFSAGVGARFAGDQERLGDFETRTAGYVVGHVVVGARWFRAGRLHQLTARVDNVGDRVYRNHLSRVKDLLPEAGRSFSLVYRLAF
jgi:iron complex outermembrane receptor protein